MKLRPIFGINYVGGISYGFNPPPVWHAAHQVGMNWMDTYCGLKDADATSFEWNNKGDLPRPFCEKCQALLEEE